MKKKTAALILVGLVAATTSQSAQAMNCGAVLDELTKAISGHLTMSPGQRAAMLRAVMSGYDRCEAGDTSGASATRDMLMEQMKKSRGGR